MRKSVPGFPLLESQKISRLDMKAKSPLDGSKKEEKSGPYRIRTYGLLIRRNEIRGGWQNSKVPYS
jgi:hypothetical protein